MVTVLIILVVLCLVKKYKVLHSSYNHYQFERYVRTPNSVWGCGGHVLHHLKCSAPYTSIHIQIGRKDITKCGWSQIETKVIGAVFTYIIKFIGHGQLWCFNLHLF